MIELPRPMRAASSFLLLLFAFGCARDFQSDTVTDSQRKAIAADVEQAMREAYDLSKPNVADRMLSLYPTSGRIISATGGRVLSSRDSLEAGIRYLWSSVVSNMRNPKWIWERFYVDV